MRPLHLLRAQTIAARLTRWFLVIGLLPLLLALFVADRTFARTMKREIENNLLAIASNKASRIRAYALERERDVSKLAQDPTIVTATGRLREALARGGTESPGYVAAAGEFRPFLTYYRERSGYGDVLLFSAAGDVVFSVSGAHDVGSNYVTGPYRQSELAKVLVRATTLLATEISHFEDHPVTHEPAAFVAAPVLKQGLVVGAVVLELSSRELQGLVQDYAGLGQTGELALVGSVRGRTVFVTPLRHDPQAAFRRQLPPGARDGRGGPLRAAARGEQGHGLGIDYRGEPVLAAWRYLPYFDCGMVAKIDTAEAFAPVYRLRRLFGTVALLTCAAIVVAALAVAATISRPIRLLHAGTEAVGRGDLGHKVGTDAADEVGQLSRAFDRMAENLSRITASRDELDRVRRELERSNRELEQFAYVASHDLQEPLRKISAFGDLLASESGSALGEEARGYLDRMLSATRRMQMLINDLLSLSRVSTRAQAFVPVDLNQTLAEVLSDLESRVVAAGARVEVAPLPPVEADPIQMHQLFQNLVGNAVKFRREGVPPVVRVYVAPGGNAETAASAVAHTAIVVEDNGIGFEAKHAERIFGIFQRLHNRTAYEGTGIGLAVCRKIVARHGGTITAAGTPGAGARFLVCLPQHPPASAPQGEPT
jgi:signal transduction histidine kinase